MDMPGVQSPGPCQIQKERPNQRSRCCSAEAKLHFQSCHLPTTAKCDPDKAGCYTQECGYHKNRALCHMQPTAKTLTTAEMSRKRRVFMNAGHNADCKGMFTGLNATTAAKNNVGSPATSQNLEWMVPTYVRDYWLFWRDPKLIFDIHLSQKVQSTSFHPVWKH